MYIPSAFVETNPAVLHGLIADFSFGLLVTVREGAPVVSHLPFLLDPTAGAHGTLYAHVARGNPQWRDLDGAGEVLAIFQGPHAYVSPRWYGRGNAVPTWNYATVHVHGVPRLIDDPDAAHRQQAALSAIFEGDRADAWTLEAQPDSYIDGMMRGIVAFALPIDRMEGKYKLSQNRSPEDRAGVIAGLRETGAAGDAELAGLMAAREPETPAI
jgi:transcriptional regulator